MKENQLKASKLTI